MGRISHEVVSTVAKNQLPFVPGKKSDHSFIGGRFTLKQTAQRTGGFSGIARIVGQCSFAE